jgi:hypothetical protein
MLRRNERMSKSSRSLHNVIIHQPAGRLLACIGPVPYSSCPLGVQFTSVAPRHISPFGGPPNVGPHWSIALLQSHNGHSSPTRVWSLKLHIPLNRIVSHQVPRSDHWLTSTCVAHIFLLSSAMSLHWASLKQAGASVS